MCVQWVAGVGNGLQVCTTLHSPNHFRSNSMSLASLAGCPSLPRLCLDPHHIHFLQLAPRSSSWIWLLIYLGFSYAE